MSDRVWTVSELLAEVNDLLGERFSGLRVDGEVTNVKISGRGHVYLSLKDESASVDCVMWASRAGRLRFRVEDGLAVQAVGALTVWAPRGRFQLVLDDLQPQGVGALQLAFEQLKKRLAAEGLFDEARKRPLPALPQRVGLVTSAEGAALRDMLKVSLRFPYVRVVLAHARVQGDGAADQIAGAVRRLGGSGLVDVVVVARGGGSLEDLWAFNEEPVARAIANCPVPVVSGVGHEVDFTIADFVADVRAATPTHAAELIVGRLEDQRRRIDEGRRALDRVVARHLRAAERHLEALEGSSGLARLPQRVRLLRLRLSGADRLVPLVRGILQESIDRLAIAQRTLRRVPARVSADVHGRLLGIRVDQLTAALGRHLERAGRRLEAAEIGLRHLSPRAVLERGYSITRVEADGRALRSATGVRPGTALATILARGRVRSVVTDGTGTRAQTRRRDHQPRLFDDEEETTR